MILGVAPATIVTCPLGFRQGVFCFLLFAKHRNETQARREERSAKLAKLYEIEKEMRSMGNARRASKRVKYHFYASFDTRDTKKSRDDFSVSTR